MSLLVWMPLNGNLDNKGLSEVTIVNNTANYTDSGKIGRALCANGSTYVQFGANELNGLKKFSISCWKKTLSASAHTDWGGVFSVGLYTKAKQSLGGYEKTSKIWMQRDRNTSVNTVADIYWTYDKDVSGAKSTQYLGCNFNNGEEWTHCTVTCDGEYFRYYKNGVLLNTSYKISDYLDDYYLVGNQNCYLCHNNSQNYLNDFRIYDHCLSASEVKEISKGLVLHYPFNDPYIEGTRNLMGKKGENFTEWSSYGFGSLGIKSIESGITPAISGQVCRVTSSGSSTENQYCEMAALCDIGSPIVSGECITFSVYVKGDGNTIGKNGLIHVYNSNGTDTQSDTVCQFIFTNEWQRVSGQFIWKKSTQSGNLFNVYVVGSILKDESYLFCNAQLEKTDHVTPYISSIRTAETVMADCSGYGNNGVITGSGMQIKDNGTPRYNKNILMSSTTANIITCSNFNLQYGPTTMNVWIKPIFNTEVDDSNIYVIYSNEKCFTYHNFPYFYHNGSQRFQYVNYWADGNWHMFTCVYDGTNTKIYIDGNEINTYYNEDGDADTKVWKNYLQVKIKNNNVSDLRIYTTALSANDIQELYNTSAKINKNGTLMCYEIKED